MMSNFLNSLPIHLKGWMDLFAFFSSQDMRFCFFFGLNFNNQVLAESEIVERSELKVVAEEVGSSTIRYRLVSPANRRILAYISITMSLSYVKNKRGPKIDP
jgi:hypothetical protein